MAHPRRTRYRRIDRPELTLKALTVTELLLAVAIIAILAVLIFGAFQKSRKTALSLQCISRMRQLGVAAHRYIGENSGRLPYRSDDPNWMFNMGPYLGLHPVSKTGNQPETKAFFCPDDPSTAPRQQRTYRYHQTFPSPEGSVAYGRSNYIPSRFLEIVSPGTHAMIFCVAYTGPRKLDIWRFDEAIWKQSVDLTQPPDQSIYYPRPHYQGKAVNILYSDGHCARAAYPLSPLVWNFDGR